MIELAPIIQDLTVILVSASVVTLLFQYIKQPVVLGYLVAGLLIGPHLLPNHLVTDIPTIQVIAQLGVIFLMFSLGLEFSFHKLARVGFSAGITGVIEVSLIAGVGFVAAKLMGWGLYDSLFLGAALSISSTTIIIKSLEELRLKTKRFAELIFGLLVVEDLLAILIIVALSTMATTHNLFSLEIIFAAGKLFMIVGSWFVIGYFVVPFFFRRVISYASQETLTIVSIAFCLLLVMIAVYFDYSAALGAFIMGSILAETPQVHRIEELIRPIRDIFAAVFFVSVGMLIDPKVILHDFPVVLLFTTVMILGKIIAPSIGSILTGQSFNTSLRVGFGMAQIGEFSFIIAGLGTIMHVTSDKLYPTVVAVALISTFTGPYLIRFSGQLVNQIERRLSPNAKSFLQNYSSWVYQALSDNKDRFAFRKAIIRFVVNAIMLSVVFTLTSELLTPYLSKVIHQFWVVQMASWLTALIFSSPFLWAMLFAFRLEATPHQSNRNALSLQILILWVMSFAEVSFFSMAYFHTWIVGLTLLGIAVFFFVVLYSRLEKFYQWFEQRLLANIRPPVRSDKSLKKLAPWDNHLVQVVVSHDSPYIGRTLEECQIRQRFGVNIVAIRRGGKLILAPRGTQDIAPFDKLKVLGSDEQIDQFKKMVETPVQFNDVVDVMDNFILKAIMLDQENSFVGKTIRDSHIREKANGLVVGLERQGVQQLNPDPATVLAAGDILLMVGEADKLTALV